MPIERVGKYLESSDLSDSHSLGIETSQLEDCIREIQSRNILGTFGCPVFGFRQSNVDFFSEIPFIRHIWFWEIALKDIEGLYTLRDLESFGVSEKRPPIDFSRFVNLKKAVWHPVKNDSGLEELDRLSILDVWRFKPKDKSYTSIALPKFLKKLELNWCSPVNFDGLPVLEQLEELQVHYCRNLESIESLPYKAPRLKRLVITRCPNLSNYAFVNERKWEHLYINIKGKAVAQQRTASEKI